LTVTVRSALYIPGDQTAKLAKAFDRGADAVIIDLEDAVPPAAKDTAREAVSAWLATLGERPPAQVWVRVNPGPMGVEDLLALGKATAAFGFVLAKADGPEPVAEAARVLDDLGSSAVLSPLLESGAAILRASKIATSPRVAYLQVGEVDFCADTGITPGEDGRELLWARSAVVVASAAARIAPPIGPVSTDFRNIERLRTSTLALRRLGYVGRACIHPAQVAVANAVFTPSAEEVETARALVADFEAAGGGVVLDRDGRMVDMAVVRQAQLLLSLAR
jgi:citrate lyase subunit beta / citryl-CoA lyase